MRYFGMNRAQVREVERLRSQAEGMSYEMRELRAEVRRAQEQFAVKLQRFLGRADKIVSQQKVIADRLAKIQQGQAAVKPCAECTHPLEEHPPDGPCFCGCFGWCDTASEEAAADAHD